MCEEMLHLHHRYCNFQSKSCERKSEEKEIESMGAHLLLGADSRGNDTISPQSVSALYLQILLTAQFCPPCFMHQPVVARKEGLKSTSFSKGAKSSHI